MNESDYTTLQIITGLFGLTFVISGKLSYLTGSIFVRTFSFHGIIYAGRSMSDCRDVLITAGSDHRENLQGEENEFGKHLLTFDWNG